MLKILNAQNVSLCAVFDFEIQKDKKRHSDK